MSTEDTDTNTNTNTNEKKNRFVRAPTSRRTHIAGRIFDVIFLCRLIPLTHNCIAAGVVPSWLWSRQRWPKSESITRRRRYKCTRKIMQRTQSNRNYPPTSPPRLFQDFLDAVHLSRRHLTDGVGSAGDPQ